MSSHDKTEIINNTLKLSQKKNARFKNNIKKFRNAHRINKNQIYSNGSFSISIYLVNGIRPIGY